MSAALVTLLAPVAARLGAELVGRVLGERFGPAGGELVELVIGEIADQAGVAPAELAALPEAEISDAVDRTEDKMPELIALWSRGLDGQFALLQAETAQGGWAAAWRWGWMYLLGVMWFVRLMVVPIVDNMTGADMAADIDMSVMLTLTSWFIGLYMGGHTLKELGRSAVEAVRASRGEDGGA